MLEDQLDNLVRSAAARDRFLRFRWVAAKKTLGRAKLANIHRVRSLSKATVVPLCEEPSTPASPLQISELEI
jgi:hypothetical protein